jgi:hypothetical protein
MSRISLSTIKEEHATLNAMFQSLLMMPKKSPLVHLNYFLTIGEIYAECCVNQIVPAQRRSSAN